MSAAELVIVRHADTDWTASGQHTGHTDIPLNETGRVIATRLGPRLAEWSFAEVWCSPLQRAEQTCELAGYGERRVIHDELVEWDYGRYEGITRPEIEEQAPGWDLWRDGCPGGEDAAAVGARADAMLARLPPQGHVLAFSHGHFLRTLTARRLGLAPTAGAIFLLTPGAIGTLGREHGHNVLSRLG